MNWLPARAEGAELAVIYFAGHGMVQQVGAAEEGFLLAYDADPDMVVGRGVSMTDLAKWVKGLNAGAVVVILDCCHSGKVLLRDATARGPTRDLGLGPAILQGITGKGRFLIASCDEGQKSIESPERKHGLFTYHLLKGLAGAADRDGDRRVGLAELFSYISTEVAHDARVKFGLEQTPWTHTTWAKEVYIARVPERDAAPADAPTFERLWRERGPEQAVRELDNSTPAADEERLTAALRFLRGKAHSAAVPFFLRHLPHPSESIRQRAKKGLQVVGWDKALPALEALARQNEEQRLSAALEGLGAFEAHAEVVRLLDRLVISLHGDLRQRALSLLERKRLGLDLDKLAMVFGEINSPYHLEKVLGSGLLTAAYLARHALSGLEVVVRVLRPDLAHQAEMRARFLDLNLRSMRYVHQNLVVTRDVRAFPDRDVCYVVRDFVSGVTLRQVLEGGHRFDGPQVLRILHQILEALGPIHQAGDCHGGVKPSNIFLVGDDRVVLGDASLPLQGIGVVSDRLSYEYRYVPPEYFQGGGQLAPPSDLYSLGCVAFELLCHRPLFAADNYMELAAKHLHDPVPAPSFLGSPLGITGDKYLARLLAKGVGDRFTTQAEALTELAKLQTPIFADMGTEERATAEAALREDSLAKYQSVQSILDFSRAAVPTLGESVPVLDVRADSVVNPLKRQIGPYQVIRQLGRGGMGAVYLAHDPRLDREVALKIPHISGSRPDLILSRFSREARVVARVRHPNICPIYDVGESEGIVYLAMAYVEGRTLAEIVHRDGPLPQRKAAAIVYTVAEAMEEAHTAGVFHRDLKPANIKLDQRGQPIIMDFGLAGLRREQEQEQTVITQTGTLLGTPAYMAPEQIEGKTEALGPGLDVYSLGVVLYELLTGSRPFSGTTASMIAQILYEPPKPPSAYRADIDPILDAICLKAIAKSVEERYPSMAGFAAALAEFLGTTRSDFRWGEEP
jgi:serine/threonine protein kinase